MTTDTAALRELLALLQDIRAAYNRANSGAAFAAKFTADHIDRVNAAVNALPALLDELDTLRAAQHDPGLYVGERRRIAAQVRAEMQGELDAARRDAARYGWR